MYTLAPNQLAEKYPYSIGQLRKDNPQTSFPKNPTDELLASWNVFPVVSTAAQYDPVTQVATQEGCTFNTDLGRWETAWVVRDKTAEELQADKDKDAARLDSKLDALWSAADAYQSSYISSVAVGLLTIGVMQQLPKALAVMAWSSSIWDAYYTRKATVTLDSVDDHDFTVCGPMPHTVPELRTELGL